MCVVPSWNLSRVCTRHVQLIQCTYRILPMDYGFDVIAHR